MNFKQNGHNVWKKDMMTGGYGLNHEFIIKFNVISLHVSSKSEGNIYVILQLHSTYIISRT